MLVVAISRRDSQYHRPDADRISPEGPGGLFPQTPLNSPSSGTPFSVHFSYPVFHGLTSGQIRWLWYLVRANIWQYGLLESPNCSHEWVGSTPRIFTSKATSKVLVRQWQREGVHCTASIWNGGSRVVYMLWFRRASFSPARSSIFRQDLATIQFSLPFRSGSGSLIAALRTLPSYAVGFMMPWNHIFS